MLGQTPTTTADWLTAIGTVGAVVVALGLSIVPSFVRWLKRPRLAVRVGQTEPHVRMLFDDSGPLGEQVRGQLVRLEIVNKGHRHADEVRVTLRRWLVRTMPESPWADFDVDPIPLPWVNPAESQPAFSQAIAAKSSGLVELAVRDGDSVRPAMSPKGALSRRWSAPWPFAWFVAEVVVTASNTEPTTAHVEFGSGANQSIHVTLASSLPKDVQHMGLVTVNTLPES